MKDMINLFYYKIPVNELGILENEPLLNFGDELGPEIIEQLFGYKIRYTEDIGQAELISVGSLLQTLDLATVNPRNTIHVWGSGYIWDKDSTPRKNTVYHAVRGSKTRARLPQEFSHIPLGDPGLLCNLVYNSADSKTDKIGIIPHYYDRDLPLVKEFESDSRYTTINVVDTPQNVIKKITQCKLILSSSLHGLIVSDSFGIPNFHLKLSENLAGGDNDYKFNDYYSATGNTYKKADSAKIFDETYLQRLISDYTPIHNLAQIQDQLIKAFPYPAREISNEERAELKEYRKNFEYRQVCNSLFNAQCELNALREENRILAENNAYLSAELDSFRGIKRTAKRLLGNLLRKVKGHKA